MPSPQKSRCASNRITDFDDDEDESDDADNSDGSGSGAATAASAAAAAAEAALSKLAAEEQPPSSPSAAAATTAGGGSDVGLWLLDRPEALEDAYLQLTHSLGQHNQRAGRIRAAARCWGRRVELLLERGEVGVAQARLSNLADLYQVRVCLFSWKKVLPRALFAAADGGDTVSRLRKTPCNPLNRFSGAR